MFFFETLTDDERQWVEQQVLACPELAIELKHYQMGITAIPYGSAPVDLASNIKNRLFEQLQLEAITSGASEAIETPIQNPAQRSINDFIPFLTVRSTELQWGDPPHRCPGLQVALLHADPVTREYVSLLKAEPGFTYPAHRHGGVEEIYMLSGDLKLEGITYYQGDYIRSATGSTHAVAHSIAGCIFFFRSSMDDEYFTSEN